LTEERVKVNISGTPSWIRLGLAFS